jgi:glycosyltransferase involved in cell wall biosynthesis
MAKALVFHIINGLGAGGAEALLFRLVARKSNFNHEVVALANRDRYTLLLEQHGIPVHHLHISSPLSAAGKLGKLSSLVEASQPQIIEGWMYGSNLAASFLGRKYGVPVVWGIHSSTLHGLGLATRVAARVGGLFSGRLADQIVNCSTRSAELHRRIGYSQSVTVVHNGYDETTFHPDEDLRSAARRELQIEQDTFLIGSIARWNIRKDVPNLLQALHLLNGRQLPARTILIGGGLDPSNAELVSTMKSLGVARCVSLLGHRTDLEMLARAIDLHVLPSATEAFPNVVAETMLSGTPNVVTDVGDAALIVGDTGWVVPPRDPASLAASIEAAHREWKDNPEQWQKRRATARELIADRFTFERMAQAYEHVWSEVINARDEKRRS